MLTETNSLNDISVFIDEDGLYDDTVLCETYELIMSGRVTEGMNKLLKELLTRQLESSELEWKEFVRGVCLRNPLKSVLHKDPFTHRAFEKPRGYSGDAILMDYVYGANTIGPPPETCEVGKQVFAYMTNAPSAKAVRHRAVTLAKIIDEKAGDIRRPDILSIAAGHLREANLCGSLYTGRIGHWQAFDTDPESLSEIDRCYARYGVSTRTGTVRQLLSRKVKLDTYDFVYTTGLFDYLHQRLAAKLIEYFFELLRPGGELVVANFTPGNVEKGYMESFMDWVLVYRDSKDMLELANAVDQSLVRNVTLFTEAEQRILFLRIAKK